MKSSVLVFWYVCAVLAMACCMDFGGLSLQSVPWQLWLYVFIPRQQSDFLACPIAAPPRALLRAGVFQNNVPWQCFPTHTFIRCSHYPNTLFHPLLFITENYKKRSHDDLKSQAVEWQALDDPDWFKKHKSMRHFSPNDPPPYFLQLFPPPTHKLQNKENVCKQSFLW